MKVVLVFFNYISTNQQASVEFTSYCLVKRCYDEGILEKVICVGTDKNVDVPTSYITAIDKNLALKLLLKLLSVLQVKIPKVHTRWLREAIFDLYSSRKLSGYRGVRVFCARPDFLRVVRKAKANGNPVWVQTLTPHPLLNFSLVRNEEIRFEQASRGGYSNLSRTVNIIKAINESDRVFTLSQEIAAFTYKSYADFVDRTKLVGLRHYFGVAQSEYSVTRDQRGKKQGGAELRFLHVSYMSMIKGLPYLLEAWKILLERHSVAGKLILVGQIDSGISKVIRDHYGQVPNVEFVGRVPNLTEFYRQADVFVSPSVADAGPTTILEAMLAGVPVIASKNCGFASLITEGQEGFTYNYNDVERLSELMYWFFENADQIRNMGNNARNAVADFSIDRYTDELATAFKREY